MKPTVLPTVLIVDDEDSIRKLLRTRLDRDGYPTVVCSSGAEALKAIQENGAIGVVVTDLKMPGEDGFSVLETAHKKSTAIRSIVITGHGEKDAAVRSLKLGASDYLEKPFDMDEFAHTVGRCAREFELTRENAELVDRLEARVSRVEGKEEDEVWFVSKSSSMEKTNEWINVLRRESMRGTGEEPTVLIQGESGTGKEGIARMIHAGSRRARGPWVAVNCANFSEQLLESELFGHERGAFTGAQTLKRGLFEIAKGGTLFLDEIGEMDIKIQAKLLRVLQEKTFRRVGGTADLSTDVRVVAATNRNLKERSAPNGGGGFREDLYHRLNQVVIDLPALRDRSDDIVPMAKQFAEKAFHARGKTFEGFTPDGENALTTYNWPGNVRELWNVLDRVALLWQGKGKVMPRHFSLPQTSQAVGEVTGFKLESVANPYQAPDQSGVGGYMELKRKWSDSFEREYLLGTLQRHGGNVSAAAREAKLDRSNFLRLLRRHQLKAESFRKIAA